MACKAAEFCAHVPLFYMIFVFARAANVMDRISLYVEALEKYLFTMKLKSRKKQLK